MFSTPASWDHCRRYAQPRRSDYGGDLAITTRFGAIPARMYPDMASLPIIRPARINAPEMLNISRI